MIAVSVGIGKNDDARRAAADATTQAIATLPKKRADSALVFGSSRLDQDAILKGVEDVVRGIPIVGCSSAYEITSESLATEGSVVVVLFNSDQIRFSTGFGTHIGWNPRQSGKDCAQTIDPTSKDILLFANSLHGGVGISLEAVREKYPNDIMMLAAGASDNLRFFETSQYFNNSAYSDAIVALGMSGVFKSAAVSTNGFLPVGVLKRITKSKDVVIEEIENAPAVKLYDEYFGEEFADMLSGGKLMSYASSYPIGIYEGDSVKPLLRIPTHIDIETGKIHLGGSVPENSGLRLMISDKQQNMITAKGAARDLMRKLDGKKPKFVLMVSSVARHRLFGKQWDEEIRMIQEIVGLDVPIAGFYSYAEFAGNVNSNKDIYLNNGSLILWAMAE